MKRKNPLRLMVGGKPRKVRLGNVTVVPITRSDLPEHLEGLVFEEDTHLVLTVDNDVPVQESHPIRALTEMIYTRPYSPGSLVIRGMSWFGVVIDLDREPSCEPHWVNEVYAKIGQEVAKREITSLGLHLLGAVHGGLDRLACLQRFIEEARKWQLASPCSLYLVVPGKELTTTKKQLASLAHA